MQRVIWGIESAVLVVLGLGLWGLGFRGYGAFNIGCGLALGLLVLEVSGVWPMRIWVVECDGVRIGHGPDRAEANDEYFDLLAQGDRPRMYSKWMMRRSFEGLAESAGR